MYSSNPDKCINKIFGFPVLFGCSNWGTPWLCVTQRSNTHKKYTQLSLHDFSSLIPRVRKRSTVV